MIRTSPSSTSNYLLLSLSDTNHVGAQQLWSIRLNHLGVMCGSKNAERNTVVIKAMNSNSGIRYEESLNVLSKTIAHLAKLTVWDKNKGAPRTPTNIYRRIHLNLKKKNCFHGKKQSVFIILVCEKVRNGNKGPFGPFLPIFYYKLPLTTDL